MKWKRVLVLGLCLALMGCGQAADKAEENNPGGTTFSETQEKESAGKEQEASRETVEAEGKMQNQEDKEGAGMTVKELQNSYQRAAFFLDEVFASNQSSTLVSPLSLEMALGLAAEGASGESAQELYKYLGREDYADWAKEYLDFAKSLESDGPMQEGETEGSFEPSRYSFRYELANSIWVKKQCQLQESYQKLVSEKFGAEARNVDFAGEPQGTADLINSWCDEHTHGMIPKMVEPDMFDGALVSILMNSVYFESPWTDSWGLMEHEFTDAKGTKTTQEMLSDRLGTYYENEYCTAFAKDYYNGFRFIGILPKQEGDFRVSELDLKSLLDSETKEYEVNAIAPKLDFETATKSKEIVNILKAQGLNKVFDPGQAEFDKLVEGQELYVDDILQKCRLEMDEEGTRAAAVTAIMMRLSSVAVPVKEKEVKDVYLDRPFAFMIYDSNNDQIVFIGKVTEIP